MNHKRKEKKMEKEPTRWTEAFKLVKDRSLAKNLSAEEMRAPIVISGEAAESLVANLKMLDMFKAHSLSKSGRKVVS